jgi:hypothetical protein
MSVSQIGPRLVSLAARAASPIESNAAPADRATNERREEATSRVAEILSSPMQGKLRLDAEALSVVQSIADARSADGVFAGISRLRDIVAGLKSKSRSVPVTDLFAASPKAVNPSNVVAASGAAPAAEPTSRATLQDEPATTQPASTATTTSAGEETGEASGASATTPPQATAPADTTAPAEEPATEQPNDEPAPAETTTEAESEATSSTTPSSSDESSETSESTTLGTVVESTIKGNAFGLQKK